MRCSATDRFFPSLALLLTGALLWPGLAGCGDDDSSSSKTVCEERPQTQGMTPTIKAVKPSVVPASGNVAVVAIGTGFVEGLAVSVGGRTATGVELLDQYGTSLIFVVPPGIEGEQKDVVVALPSGVTATLTGGITYGPAAAVDPATLPLALTSVAPTQVAADGGALVVAQGAGFVTGIGFAVGGQAATEVRILDSQGSAASFLAPPGPEGQSVDVVVTRQTETATLTRGLSYVAPVGPVDPARQTLTLTSLNPALIPAEGQVWIVLQGTGFVTGLEVLVAGQRVVDPLRLLDAQGTALSFLAPAGAEGEVVDVQVRRPDGQSATLTASLTYGPPSGANAELAQLAVTSIAPATGPASGGTPVTITGAGFRSGLRVTFAGEPAEIIQVLRGHTILAHTPPHAVGVADVTVINPSGKAATLAAGFTYEPAAAPVVDQLLPAAGPVGGGSETLVLGRGFDPTARVLFGDLEAVVTLRQGDGVLGVQVPAAPAGLAEGAVDVTVRNGDGQSATLADGFTYVAPGQLELRRAIPAFASALGGDQIALLGAGFEPQLQIFFGELPALAVEVLSPELLLATTPPHGLGPAAVSAQPTVGPRVVLQEPFWFVEDVAVGPNEDLIALDAVVPATGTQKGGTRVAVIGTAFGEGLELTFDGAAAREVSVVSTRVALATTPVGELGPATLAARRPGMAPASLVDAFTYLEDRTTLKLLALSPDRGPAAGGGEVLLVGQGFADGLTVTFNRVAAPEVELLSGEVARVVVPAGRPGTVDVQAQVPGQAGATLAQAYTYEDDALPQLTLTEVAPEQGSEAGGTSVVLTGAGFLDGAIVLFGGQVAPVVRFLNSSVLVAVTPAGAVGATDVTVENPDETRATLANGFVYLDAEELVTPELLGVAPNRGPIAGGTALAIQGNALQNARTVRLDGVPATGLELVDPSLLLCFTPPGQPGPADIEVQLLDGSVLRLPSGFFYHEGNGDSPDGFPTITRVSPTVGPTTGGTIVTLRGTGFKPDATVLLGARVAQVWSRWGETVINVRTPVAPPGRVDITVVNPGGQSATRQAGFTYYEDQGGDSPTLSGVVPATGPAAGGTELRVTGTNLLEGLTLLLGAAPAEVRSVAGRTTITAVSGPGALGATTVAVTNPDGRTALLERGFTYIQEPPELLQVIPATGPLAGGTPVVLYGRKFAAGAQVFFGDQPGVGLTVHSPDAIGATTPAGAEGPVPVRVVNPDGQATELADGFTYRAEQHEAPPPALRTIVPDRGPVAGGTVAIVDGTGFVAGIQVLFGGVPATRVRVIGPTQLVVVTPPTDAPRSVEVALLNPDGQGSTKLNGFRYLTPVGAAPRLLSITPAGGPSAGGASVIMTASGLQAGGLAFLGYVPFPQYVRLNDAIATGTTPVGDPGPADVAWTNPDGQSALLPNGYFYAASPKLDAIEPVVGPVAGKTFVTLGGSHFQAGATVTVGGRPATEVLVLSQFVITCKTPAGDAGPAHVVVTNPDGQQTALPLGFTYLLPPELLSARPTKVLSTGGTPVVVRGKHLPVGLRLALDGVNLAGVRRVSADTVTFLAPPLAVGAKPTLRVTGPDGQTAVLNQAFEVIDPATLGDPPTIDLLKPPSGPSSGNTAGYLTGSGFQDEAIVLFGGWPAAEVGVIDEGLILFVTPEVDLFGVVDVFVVNPDGQSDSVAEGFEFLDPDALDPAPEIESIRPAEGPTAGGKVVRIEGAHLTDGGLVLLGQRPMRELRLIDVDVLQGATPPCEIGPADLVITNPDGQTAVLEDAFRCVPPPVIMAVVPPSGPSIGSQPFKVTGNHFVMGDAPAERSQVAFCDDWDTSANCETAPAALTKVISVNEIQAVTPAHTAGFVQVVVINPDGQVDVAPRAYQFTPPPAIDDVEPTHGSTLGGEWITITGEGFLAGATVTLGRTQCTEVQVRDQNTVRCLTPEVEVPGPVAITVHNLNGGDVTLGGGFLFIAPPTITTLYPTHGPEAGATAVTLEGTFFEPGPPAKSRVFFGLKEVPAADVNVLSPSIIQVVTPPGIGLVSVRVVNPDEQFDLIAGAFTYTPPLPKPVLTNVAPDYGSIDGGTLVNVIGNAFLAGATVFFGKGQQWTEGARPLVKNNGTLILVTTPAHAAGKVDVKVRNTDGQEVILADAFEYIEPLALPALAFINITPERGPIGGGITAVITGRGFKFGIKVFIGDVATSKWSEATETLRLGPTALRIVLPPSPTGQGGIFDVMLQNPTVGAPDAVVQADAFRYTAGAVFLPKGHRLPIDGRYDQNAAIFDANGDGLNDVLVLRNGPDELFINTPQGDEPGGWFVDQTAALLPGAPNCHSVYATVADFDRDDDRDVMVWCTNNWLYLYRNEGDGKFTVESKENIDGLTDIEMGDLNCDGIPDLFITRDNRVNLVRVSDGRGGFWDIPGVVPNVSEPGRGAAIGDVDNDGDKDVLIANDTAYQNRLYYNNCNNVPVPPACSQDIPGCTMQTNGGHRYAFCTTGRAWQEAQTHCRLYGFDLATINDQAEQTWVRSKIGSTSWIGFTDQDVEGTWAWKFGVSNYNLWCANQPNGGEPHDCAAMSTNATGCYDDTTCTTGYQYVCESAQPVCGTAWKLVDGTYGEGRNFPVSGDNTRDAKLFDVNGDGRLDAILINNGQNNRIHINNGGSFNTDLGTRYPQNEANLASYGSDLVDVDLDGDLDLFVVKRVATNPDRFWPELYLNDRNNGGDGTFNRVTPSNLPPWFTEDTYNVAFGDLNDDLLPDIYVVNYNLQDRILFNHGYLPNLPQIPANQAPVGVYTDNTLVGFPADNEDTVGVDLGDVDGDGDPDLVTCAYPGRVRLLVNDGSGNFFDRTSQMLPAANFDIRCWDLRLVDLDQDDDLDLLVASWQEHGAAFNTGLKYQFVNDGHGVFDRNVTATNMPNYNGHCGSIDFGDIDQDGDLDTVYAGYDPWSNPDFKVLTHGGDPFAVGGGYFFDQTANWFLGATPAGRTRAVRLVDLNDDGFLDMYVGRYSDQNLLYHFSIADRKFKDVTVSHLSAISDNTYDVDVFDFDQDGDQDLFVTNNGLNRLHIAGRDGRFSDVTSTNLPQISLDSRASALGDVDEDTLVDVISINWDVKNTLYMNVGGGDMVDGSDNLPWSDDLGRDIVIADFDGDGDLDYCAVNQGQNRIYLNQSRQPR